MRIAVWLVALGACGRVSFDPLTDASQPSPDARTSPCTAFGPFDAPVKLQGVQSAFDDGAATITPDGKHLYYTHPLGTGSDIEIFVADRTGDFTFANARLATALDSPGNDVPATISPDGLTLYVASDRDGQNRMYAATRASFDEDFANPQMVFPFLANAVALSLSPDGLTAYATINQDLYRATRASTATDFTSQQILTALDTADFEFDLHVAPDNRAFFDRNNGAAAPSFWTADLDPTTLAFSNARKWELSQPGIGEHSLRMSSDGSELWLAIHDDANAGNELYLSRRACLD